MSVLHPVCPLEQLRACSNSGPCSGRVRSESLWVRCGLRRFFNKSPVVLLCSPREPGSYIETQGHSELLRCQGLCLSRYERTFPKRLPSYVHGGGWDICGCFDQHEKKWDHTPNSYLHFHSALQAFSGFCRYSYLSFA